MRIDERGRNQCPIEFDDLCLGMQRTSDRIRTDPDDHTIFDCNSSCIGGHRRIDVPADQQLTLHDRPVCLPNGGGLLSGLPTGMPGVQKSGCDLGNWRRVGSWSAGP